MLLNHYEKKLRWYWYFFAVIALCLIGLMLHPSIIYSETFFVSCAYVVVDAFALAVGYSMLKKLKILALWKFAVYIAAIVIGSLAINFYLSAIAYKNFLLFSTLERDCSFIKQCMNKSID